MNTPKVFASLALLVLAAFWEVVLLDLYMGVGLIALFVAPFIVLVVIGIYGLLDGLGKGSYFRRSSAKSGAEVGPLGTAVLRMVAQGKSQQEIAAATLVSAALIEAKVEALTRAGFLEGNALSEKGFDFLGRSG